MTKKDYIAIGKILAGDLATASPLEKGKVLGITFSLADLFKQDNPNFDRERFYAFVGVPR